jgi:hypothetical protein
VQLQYMPVSESRSGRADMHPCDAVT